MTEPPSRQYEAHKANNGGSHDEYDPHGVAARDMVAECPDCAARDGMGPPWYGSNPWSAPTTAQSLDFVMESGTNILGVCGASPSNKLNNYNTPLDGHWGMMFSDKDGSGGVTLSMAQWSWADKSESSAALAPGACRSGDWDSLSESGEFLRAYVRDATRA